MAIDSRRLSRNEAALLSLGGAAVAPDVHQAYGKLGEALPVLLSRSVSRREQTSNCGRSENVSLPRPTVDRGCFAALLCGLPQVPCYRGPLRTPSARVMPFNLPYRRAT